MPKAEAGSLKAIGNHIKSIGLQKLRWYCQMCVKQCRDENGFKCHLTSESHLRQMRLFSENPNSIIDNFSKEFERGYLDTLSHLHNTKRTSVNKVYQEYIADKNHVHMNSTKWSALSEFCKHLGKSGSAIVDETEKGWFIQWIDRNPKMVAKQALADQRQKAEIDDVERNKRMIDSQINAAIEKKRKFNDENGIDDDDNNNNISNELIREEGSSLKIGLSMANKNVIGNKIKKNSFFDVSDDKIEEKVNNSNNSNNLSVIEKLMQEDQKKINSLRENEDKKNRKDYWLHTNIVVKIINKKLSDGKFYKKKGVVCNISDKYIGEVKLPDGTRIRLDQEHLETVLPKIGCKVLIVNGLGRGCIATLLKINEENFNCDIKIDEIIIGEVMGIQPGDVLNNIEYEDVCKLNDE